jgi:hypothetical protein
LDAVRSLSPAAARRLNNGRAVASPERSTWRSSYCSLIETVVLLFTDLEGSTRSWASDPGMLLASRLDAHLDVLTAGRHGRDRGRRDRTRGELFARKAAGLDDERCPVKVKELRQGRVLVPGRVGIDPPHRSTVPKTNGPRRRKPCLIESFVGVARFSLCNRVASSGGVVRARRSVRPHPVTG